MNYFFYNSQLLHQAKGGLIHQFMLIYKNWKYLSLHSHLYLQTHQFKLMESGKLIKTLQDAVITTIEERRKEPGNLHVGPEIQT